MKKLIFTIWILALCVVLDLNKAEGQWTSIGPNGANIIMSDSYGDNIFIVTEDQSTFKSTNNGNNWEHVYTNTFPYTWFIYITSIEVMENYVFISRYWNPVRSTDYGETWNIFGEPGSPLKIFKYFDGVLYLGDINSGLWKSVNKGDNWSYVKDFYTYGMYYISDIEMHGSNLFVSGDNGIICRSSNAGLDWTVVLDTINNLNVTLLDSYQSYLFAVLSGNGIIRSSDNGNTWTDASNGLTNLDINSLKFFNSNIYAATNNGVFSSSDNGSNWIPDVSGLAGTKVNTLFSDNSTLFAGCSDSGLFKTTNNGANWINANDRLTGKPILSLASNSQYLFAGTINGELYRTADLGINWTLINNEIQNIKNVHLLVKDNLLFCGTESSAGYYNMFRSTNNGDNWDTINQSFLYSIVGFAVNYSGIFAAGTYGVYFSSNNGNTWMEKNNGHSQNEIRTIGSAGNYIYIGENAGAVNDYIYMSTNNGDNWVLKNNGFEGKLNSFSSNGNYIYAASSMGVFRSSDNGDNWILHNNGFVNQNAYSVYASENNVLASNDSGFFYSDDNGLNWFQDNEGFKKDKIITQIHSYQGQIFAGLRTGSVWKSSTVLPVELLSFTSSVNENNVKLIWQTNTEINNSGFEIERSATDDQWIKAGFVQGNGNSNEPKEYSFTDKNLAPGKYKYRLKQIDFNGSFEYYSLAGEVFIGVPDKYELSQNYPNPFNPATVILYSLTENSFTTLKIYDVTGREMTRLVNEKQEAGRYEVVFNGSNLASGVYLYELRSGDFVAQKKMVILK